ncbi:MAG: hypothetical protein GX318_04275 [Clostridia bacterium]|nr:hypothetical protein [Clostridia bacterium]
MIRPTVRGETYLSTETSKISKGNGSKKRRVIKVKPRAFVFGFVALYLLVNIFRMQFAIWDLNKQLDASRELKKDALAHQEILRKELQDAEKGKHVERIAREQLGLVKPGESLIIPEKSAEFIND